MKNSSNTQQPHNTDIINTQCLNYTLLALTPVSQTKTKLSTAGNHTLITTSVSTPRVRTSSHAKLSSRPTLLCALLIGSRDGMPKERPVSLPAIWNKKPKSGEQTLWGHELEWFWLFIVYSERVCPFIHFIILRKPQKNLHCRFWIDDWFVGCNLIWCTFWYISVAWD